MKEAFIPLWHFSIVKPFNLMNIAVIPARSGSKRIKNKNLKFFFGKPIIEYAINTVICRDYVFKKLSIRRNFQDRHKKKFTEIYMLI